MAETLEQTRQVDWVLPPVVDSSGNPNSVAISVTGTAGAADLSSMPYPAGLYDVSTTAQLPNPLGHYVSFAAQTADIFVMFGPTFASVTGANKPVAATTNTVSGSTGVVTMAKGVCWLIPSGTTLRVKLPLGSPANPWGAASPWRFVGYVTASAAILRVSQSSV